MKTITMYRPALQNVLNDFDRCIESFFGDSPLTPAARVFNRLPAVDIRETEKTYVLDMELPGCDEKDIEVHLDGSSISIESKQEEAHEDKKADGNYILRERKVSSFSRSFQLPENADPENVSAVFKNGVLNLEIKKRPEAQKRIVQIKAS